MQDQSQNPYNNTACVRYLILLNCSLRLSQPIALYQDRLKNAMLTKLTVVKCALISAILVGCGGGTGEKNSIDLNAANTSAATNNADNSITDQSTSVTNNQSNSENNNSLGLGSESESTTNKTFSGTVACADPREDIQNSMLLLVNAARAQARMCGSTLYPAVPALTWDNTLETTALNHSIDMSTNNFFSHTGSNGLSVADRADNAQYNWRAIGENIAAGQPTADVAVQEWLESAGHCENIMSASFQEIGAACVSDSGAQYTHYWTQVFGTRF